MVDEVSDNIERFDRPVDERQRYKLALAYDGSAFHGWQKQVSTDPENPGALRTVAGVVEDGLMRAMRQPITLVGASRTDAGVHALGQVAHFNADTPIPIERMSKAINGYLPGDVDVRSVEVADAGFDAISGAKSKQYRYRLYNTHARPLGIRTQVWHCWVDLDIDRMADAAARFVGEHDFEGFAAADHGRATTVRTILDCHIEVDEPEVQIVVSGTGFLYNMVRIIAGTLVEIGRGRLEPDVIGKVFESCDRRDAGPTLASSGLCLEWIKYE